MTSAERLDLLRAIHARYHKGKANGSGAKPRAFAELERLAGEKPSPPSVRRPVPAPARAASQPEGPSPRPACPPARNRERMTADEYTSALNRLTAVEVARALMASADRGHERSWTVGAVAKLCGLAAPMGGVQRMALRLKDFGLPMGVHGSYLRVDCRSVDAWERVRSMATGSPEGEGNAKMSNRRAA